MAQNLKINGKQYNGVAVIGAPNANGGTARFYDTSNATADADDIAIGKTAYTINGKITGTNQGGGSTLGTKTITSNGEYDAQDDGYDGYSSVDVQVPGSSPTLQAKTNIAPTTSSQTITADQGYDGLSSVQINAMPSGTAGTPTATKGAVSNHSVSVTPSVTNTTGYITGSTINGTAVTVSASELDSGSKSITANGNSQDVVGYASVDVAVPNSYSASDEGKVVSSGALVAQTSDTVTVNDTYDTTLINSLTVNVSGGGGGGTQIGQATPTNLLNMFYALEHGTAKTGTFTLATTLPNTDTVLFDTTISDPNGFVIFDTEYYQGVETTTSNFQAYQACIYAKCLVPYNRLNEYTFGFIGINENGVNANAGNWGGCTCSNLDGTVVIGYAYWTLTNGVLTVKGQYNKHTTYTPFRAQTVYRWVAW